MVRTFLEVEAVHAMSQKRDMGHPVRASIVGAGGQVGVGGGEGGEVVRAEDVGGGLLGGLEVEGPGAVPDVGGEEWGADAVGQIARSRCMGHRRDGGRGKMRYS